MHESNITYLSCAILAGVWLAACGEGTNLVGIADARPELQLEISRDPPGYSDSMFVTLSSWDFPNCLEVSAGAEVVIDGEPGEIHGEGGDFDGFECNDVGLELPGDVTPHILDDSLTLEYRDASGVATAEFADLGEYRFWLQAPADGVLQPGQSVELRWTPAEDAPRVAFNGGQYENVEATEPGVAIVPVPDDFGDEPRLTATIELALPASRCDGFSGCTAWVQMGVTAQLTRATD